MRGPELYALHPFQFLGNTMYMYCIDPHKLEAGLGHTGKNNDWVK